MSSSTFDAKRHLRDALAALGPDEDPGDEQLAAAYHAAGAAVAALADETATRAATRSGA